MGGPLDGIRVLDFTRVLSGPHCTRMLCDLGADVIKLEPPAGDLTRFATPRVNGLATYFVQQNAAKRNVSIDLANPRGVELAAGLADHCDVVVENYRPGVMAKMGLDHETLRARNERLVYASINGYGSSGPWAGRRAYAPVVQAETGITQQQGDARGGAYATDPFSHADLYTSLEATAAILAALYERERTGAGRWVEVSMAQTMLYENEHLHNELYDGDDDPGWIRSFGTAGQLVLEVASGERMAISGHPAERGTFERFVAALGLDDLADDPRLATVAGRKQHLDEIRERFAAAAAKVADGDTLEQQLAPFQLAVGKVRDARDLAESDWAVARRAVATVPDRGGGNVRIPNPPWRFDDVPIEISGEPKYRGEDNRAVLGELLGLADRDLDELESAGILSSRLPRSR